MVIHAAVARAGADISLEVYTAHERSALLDEVLGLPGRRAPSARNEAKPSRTQRDQGRELQRAVALDAVAGTLDDLDAEAG